ncbi:hypothetical protein [Roseivirga sp. UBA1976]|uniref:hypothetical protein n=1 Tax=Roseivirga sp. UBA1976 TaxID=1947386 RepID=UPI00257AA652|nr:hypothetical protein [Roseivirga sp. UBA1976]|tara:strand:- start:9319 stop:9588 length:270 start_codon:yes stop_codon:yes gene_type:complete
MANAIDRGAVNVAKILIPASIIDHSYKVLSLRHEYAKGEINRQSFTYSVDISNGGLIIDFVEMGRVEIAPAELVKACFIALEGKEVNHG